MIVGLLCARALMALAVMPAGPATLPHGDLRGSDPVRDSHVAAAPRRLTLWFTVRPQLPFSKIRLVGALGDVALGKLATDTGNAVRADVVGAMADGTYKVVWQTASSDGHPITGEYAFTVGAAVTAAVTAAASGTVQTAAPPPTAVASAPPPASMRVVRLWEFIGLLVVLGVIVFVHGVLPPLAARGVSTADISHQARGLGEIAAVIYVLAALFRLLRQAISAGAGGDASLATLTDIVTRSGWGNGWLIGVVGAVFVIIGFWLSMRRARAGTPMALTGALAMTLAPALSGHAAAAQLFIPSVTLDALHVASIGAWIGTLSVVLLVGIPAMARVEDGNADAAVSALVNSFHPIALMAAPLAVLSGLGSSVLRLGSFDALTSSRFGQVLVIKLVVVALVASFGAWNSMRSRRRLGTPSATRSIRRTALTEVALAVLVLWATTELVATPVPTELLRP